MKREIERSAGSGATRPGSGVDGGAEAGGRSAGGLGGDAVVRGKGGGGK